MVINLAKMSDMSPTYNELVNKTFSKKLYNSQITRVCEYAFRGCPITEIDLPNCSEIKEYAFYNCPSLSQAFFSTCTDIYSNAFQFCYSLSKIYFPACATIGYGAFNSCISLKELEFPNCQTIEYGAFQGCHNITKASFSNCITIDKLAFWGCHSLSSIFFLGQSVPQIASDIFMDTPFTNSQHTGKFGYIYVLNDLVSVYKTATNWSKYASQIRGVII